MALTADFKVFVKAFFKLTIVKLFGFATLILSLSRLIWYISNQFWLGNSEPSAILSSFLYGVYFDLPVIAYFYFPVWLWLFLFPAKAAEKTFITRILFVLSSAIVLVLNSIDTAYSRITARRSGVELFEMIDDEGNSLLPYFYDYGIPMIGLIIWFYLIFRFCPVNGHTLYIYGKRDFLRKGMLSTLLFCILWLAAARGGWRMKPLAALDAAEFVPSALVPLTVSTPLQIISTQGSAALPEYQFLDPQVAHSLLQVPCHVDSPNTKPNIVFIIAESLGRDYTGFLNGKPYTPFLDSLSKKCIVFPYCFANGAKSIDMVPSLFCGIPGIQNSHFVNSSFAGNRIKNAYTLFAKQGYHTSFFHGGQNGTMRFQSFLAQTGMSSYFGMDEYPNALKAKDHDGNWGIYDEPYLQYFLKCTDTMRQPFLNAVFTLSSHHPYAIPPQMKNTFPKGELPIHESIAYTDYSLKQFFEAAAKTAWYKNTIFVITADHTSYSKNAYFYSETGHYEIPVLIYMPAKPAYMRIDKTISQCDIMPTVAHLAGIESDFWGLGYCAFEDGYKGYSLHRDNQITYIVQYPYVLGMNDKGEVTDYYSRQRNAHVVSHLKREGEKFKELKQWLQASLQEYSWRMRKNQWSAENTIKSKR